MSTIGKNGTCKLHQIFKIVEKLVAVPTHLDLADSRTGANHAHTSSLSSASQMNYIGTLFPRTIQEWNDLLSDIVTSSTLDWFKGGRFSKFK